MHQRDRSRNERPAVTLISLGGRRHCCWVHSSNHMLVFFVGIAVINFNRPKAFNALSRKFVGEFRAALQELRYDQ